MRSIPYLAKKFTSLLFDGGPRAAIDRAREYVRVAILSRGSARPRLIGSPHYRAVVNAAPRIQSQAIRISVLMPVYNTPPDVLHEAIQSVLAQTYENWELCICDDCSTNPATTEMLERYRGFDPRIKITRGATNLHISEATNAAAEFATGDFVAFLDHDDLLTPDAIAHVVEVINSDSEVDLVYTDEDKLEEDGTLSEPYFKPDWSPELLGSTAYILHFMVLRKSLFLELGGLQGVFTGAQDFDLSIRATAAARKVRHIPKVLYHWRKIAGSAAATVDAKPQALVNAGLAVESYAKSVDPTAEVAPGLFTGSYRIKWTVDVERPVTLLMLTDAQYKEVEGRGNILMVEHAINSILDKSTFKNVRIIVLDNGKLPPEAKRRMTRRGVQIRKYTVELPFNFPKKMNAAFDMVETEDVIILNDDIEVITPDWIEALLAHSRRDGVGVVGALLLYPNDRIQHAGVVLGVNGASTHIFHNQPADSIGYCGYTHVVRNYSAVTGAVMATRMSVVREIGGFDESLAIDYNDIDFCLRARDAGHRVVYTPFARLYHFEGSTLVRKAVSQNDLDNFLGRWGAVVNQDPFYNPNLPTNRTDCAVYTW
jgi:GT2 family glycosyltransferase